MQNLRSVGPKMTDLLDYVQSGTFRAVGGGGGGGGGAKCPQVIMVTRQKLECQNREFSRFCHKNNSSFCH